MGALSPLVSPLDEVEPVLDVIVAPSFKLAAYFSPLFCV